MPSRQLKSQHCQSNSIWPRQRSLISDWLAKVDTQETKYHSFFIYFSIRFAAVDIISPVPKAIN